MVEVTRPQHLKRGWVGPQGCGSPRKVKEKDRKRGGERRKKRKEGEKGRK